MGGPSELLIASPFVTTESADPGDVILLNQSHPFFLGSFKIYKRLQKHGLSYCCTRCALNFLVLGTCCHAHVDDIFFCFFWFELLMKFI